MHELFAQLVTLVGHIIDGINSVTHNRGWSLVLFALGLKLIFWPLNSKQFQAMVKMQQLGPQIKALQAKYKSKEEQLKRRNKDAEALKKQQLELQQDQQRETMELYKKNGANPLAGCLPMLVPMPFYFSVYWAVIQNKAEYANQTWLWIGAPFTQHLPTLPVWKAPLLASGLALPDLALLLLYMISMYLMSRYASMPSTDPQQAQTQKMMAFISPAMLGYMGFQWKWPSAMVLYWFSFNMFTMAQQFYLLKRHHQPLSVLDNEHAVTDIPDAPAPALSSNGATNTPTKSQKKKGAKN
ncbi:MAG TPA: YidC/Oxa1 family membrane protein insertase [Candidatus Baltobacteraceae bacterium]|nr:YidC/Oxa1 family membrane protein insertase [Candidatus Baltobacteraceae bacterium]